MYDVVIISSEFQDPTAGPMAVASILIDQGLTAKTLQCLCKFSDDQIHNLVEKFIVSPKQILGVSTTFIANSQSLISIQKFISLARTKFPSITVVVGGSNKTINQTSYPSDAIFLLGQNREQDIINLFCNLTGKLPKQFNFSTYKIHFNKLFKSKVDGVVMNLDWSRGCLFNCAFCNYNLRKQKSFTKDEKTTIDELEEYYAIFKNPQVILTCNTFNESEEKIVKFNGIANSLSYAPRLTVNTRVDLLERQSASSIDFYIKYVSNIFLGLETFTPETYRIINKYGNPDQIKKFLLIIKDQLPKDTNFLASFIVGLPKDTVAATYDIVDWIKETNVFTNTQFQPLRLRNVGVMEDTTNFSVIERDPKKFGYTITEKYSITPEQQEIFSFYNTNVAELLKFKTVNWVRDDGYGFIDALADTTKINGFMNNTMHHNTIAFAFARGVDLNSYGSLQVSHGHAQNEILKKTLAEFGQEYYTSLITDTGPNY